MKKVQKLIQQEEFNLRGVYISTYIPRRCGLATYTKDLTNAINVLNPNTLAEIMAIDDKDEPVEYPWEVKFRIQKHQEADYLRAAEYINRSSTDFVNLQHEYGIFGGENGSNILTLLRNIKKPVISTFHTTLKEPSSEQKYILKKIASYSNACVVMIDEAKKRLHDIYKVPANKIAVIAHGVPNIPFSPSDEYKEPVGFKPDDFLIGSINLISPNKGIEYVIQALPKIKKIKPNVKFLMIGKTHPGVLSHEGEQYREKIKDLVKKLKLEDNFIEINEYVSLDDLIKYLKALDIYITPYRDLNATSSGTLAYAIGAGKVCISTPYIYAQEILTKGRGILIQPENVESIVKAITMVINNPKKRQSLEHNAYELGRKMVWEKVALDYLNLIAYVINKKTP